MASNSSERPPTVWYMDNRLSPVHPMFNNAPVHYDAALQQYVPNGGTVATASAVTNLLSISQPPPPRPEWTTLRAMRFWDAMFSDAMARFRSTVDVSKGRPRQYNIHEATVYAILERARNDYKSRGGPVGWWRRVRRKVADNAVTPLQGITAMASKMAPDDPFSTPVLGAVGILLDAANQAAAVRKQVIETFDGEGFENLIPIFSDVELFLGEMFREDTNIYNASLELTVTTLKAVDRTVGFYISNEPPVAQIEYMKLTTLLCTVFRGGKAIMMRGEYEKELVESLKDINTKSEKLLREASKSHMHEAHLYSEQGRRLMGTIQTTVVHGFNHFGSLLTEHTRRMDILIEQNRESHAAIRYLLVENERLRSTSPGLPSPWHPPALPATAFVHAPLALPAPAPYVTQEELQTKLGMSETGLDDILFIFDKKSDFPSRQRLQTEQIIQHQLFADWVVSASSSKILVQWEPPLPRTIADLSPLSLFCANLVQVLGAHDRFISIQWFCGRHLRGSGNGNAMLVSLIAQLLRVHHGGFDMQALSHAFDIPALLESRDTDGLIGLLEWLVRALPQTVTLFCLIDGVILYERPEHWASAEPVLLCLLQLANGSAAGATVKVLFTSTPGPPTVRAAFEEEGLIINVETLPHLAVAPSDVRFARELGQELGN
ncbi:hypothetical protein PG985_014609 [Apiospora marii]|uniref:uncharacterized protein n=1 Tax=Apiospora marii TaxID=335849 RepID=UPI00312FB5B2